jgi:hypothetical protein
MCTWIIEDKSSLFILLPKFIYVSHLMSLSLAYLLLKDLSKSDYLLDILKWYFYRVIVRFSRISHFFRLSINAYSTYSQLPFKCGRLLHPQLESAPCCGDRGPLNMPLYHNIGESKCSRVRAGNI